MIGFRRHTLSVTTIVAVAFLFTSVDAQTAPPSSQGLSITVTLALEKDHVPLGQKPRAVLTIKNISQQGVCFSTASRLYRVHIQGQDGEPPETVWQRHRHGEFRLGDGPELMDGPVVCQYIAPGASDVHIYDLTMFYNLSVPAKYAVYMEIRDEPKGPAGPSVWLRTNTAQFEIQQPPQ